MNIPKTLPNISYQVKRGLNGLGLFAKSPIKKGTWIIEYVGIRKTNKEVENSKTQYLFTVNDKITIDGSPRSNTARYINYSCNPNAEAWNIYDRIFIKAIKNIEEREEITYDYGDEFYNAYIQPKGCRCKSTICKSITK